MEGECQGCVDLNNEKYRLEEQIRLLQDDIEDLHEKLKAKGGASTPSPIAVKLMMVHNGVLFVADGAGTLWMTNAARAMERRQPPEWVKVTLPEVSNG